MDSAYTNTTLLSTDFCLWMTNQVLLKQVEIGSNFVSSPLSFHVMLSLISAGSTGNTLKQILSFLGLKSVGELNYFSSQIVTLTHTSLAEESKVEQLLSFLRLKSILRIHITQPYKSGRTGGPNLVFINGVWVDQSFKLKPSFKEIARVVYKAETQEVNFSNKVDEVRHEVNSWAEKATTGLIKGLLPSGSLDSDTRLIIANALYFKGAWNQKFDSWKTKNRDFHLLNGQSVRVPFMTGHRYEEYLYRSFYGYKVLQLPYQSGQDTRQFSMYFFLPDKNNGLQDLVKLLSSKPGFFNQQFKLWQEELPEFWIPRFKFSFEFEASQTMKEMGLNLPFINLGELKGMVNSPNGNKLSVSKILHKSFIEVNEEGTEAAASTAGSARFISAMYPTPSFVAEHPFMFMIREESSRIVFFTGAVINPLLMA